MPETRRCDRCCSDVDVRLWTPDDHAVVLTGPLSMDRVAVDEDANMVRYRANQPYITVLCSELPETLAALNIAIEEPRC